MSPQLTDLAKALWMWALSNDIALITEYIPGVANVLADAESRSMTDRTDWKLHHRLFQGIDQKWGPLARGGPVCVSPVHTTTSLIGRVLSQVQRQQAQVILVAPVWKGQPWYPTLLEMLYDYPQQLPCTLNLFQRTSNVNQMDLLPQLAVWPVSRKNSDAEVFQKQLRSSSLHPGGAKHPEPMTNTSGNGWAGVLNRDEIPFQAPFQM